MKVMCIKSIGLDGVKMIVGKYYEIIEIGGTGTDKFNGDINETSDVFYFIDDNHQITPCVMFKKYFKEVCEVRSDKLSQILK